MRLLAMRGIGGRSRAEMGHISQRVYVAVWENTDKTSP